MLFYIKKQFRRLFSSFIEIARIVWKELPLFGMLVTFMTIPSLFAGGHFSSDFFFFVIPQTILPVLILCWLASLRNWLWWIIFSVANLLFLIELGCYFCISSRLNSLLSTLLLQSNVHESAEFLQFASQPIIKSIIGSGVVAIVVLILNYLWKKIFANRFIASTKMITGCLCSVGIILTILSGYSLYCITKSIDYYSANSQHGTDYLKRVGMMRYASCPVTYYFIVKDMFDNPRLKSLDKLGDTLTNLEVDVINRKDSLNIVYVIGESLSRNKSSLFGYDVINNSPFLHREMEQGSLYIFDNIISETNQTIGIVPYMMSTCSVTSSERYGEYPLLPAILKKGGYHVRYIDNQSVIGDTHKFDFRCTYFFARDIVRNLSLDEHNDRNFEYDGQIVEAYPPIWDKKRNLTIYHLMGNHVEASKRYPEEFAKFTTDDYCGIGYSPSQIAFVSEYDNATLYNDYVLYQIIEKLRNDVAILIYASDHGDEVFDYADRDHRGRELNVTIETSRVFCEVPVIIWVSDKYKELYPDEIKSLEYNIHKPLYNTDLVHTLIDISGINTESFNPDLSLLRENGGRIDRIIQHSVHYDRDREVINSRKMLYEK